MLNICFLMCCFYGPSVDGRNFATPSICNCNIVMSKDVPCTSSLPPAPPNFNVDGFPWAMRVVAKIVSFQNLPVDTSSTLKLGPGCCHLDGVFLRVRVACCFCGKKIRQQYAELCGFRLLRGLQHPSLGFKIHHSDCCHVGFVARSPPQKPKQTKM